MSVGFCFLTNKKDIRVSDESVHRVEKGEKQEGVRILSIWFRIEKKKESGLQWNIGVLSRVTYIAGQKRKTGTTEQQKNKIK